MRDYNEEDCSPLVYCTKCLSLDIRENSDGFPVCHHCGAQAKDLDFAADIWQWMQLYAKKYGKAPLEYHTPYDDIRETYNEETEYIASEADCLNSGLICRDVINLNLNKIDKL